MADRRGMLWGCLVPCPPRDQQAVVLLATTGECGAVQCSRVNRGCLEREGAVRVDVCVGVDVGEGVRAWAGLVSSRRSRYSS
ncbi:hypothetical protein K431DRAFT_154020 [Polychaeton citri CBS 116435]|uniref:Uncharacterized protein n=1 Tax=Polychaeton citri CBS 116435 TaxID=1314669 RepID=A0A9P4Q3K8_9PEZI|nr:hypothetical protein K431DRAFT_154020 [Polychaeton citri CBS 116435]